MSVVVGLAGAVLLAVSLPVVAELALFTLANLLLRGGRAGPPPASGSGGRIAVLIPAHDEAAHIARCVASVLACDRGAYDLDVVVIADNCRDETARIAGMAGARALERFDEDRRGKGAALDFAISRLINEPYLGFIVVDADSVVSANLVRAVGDRFARGDRALQCVNLPLNADASRRIRLMNLALLSMNVYRPMGRELLGLSVGLFGNGFALSRDLLLAVPYSANSITEDLEYHLRLIERGYRVRFAPEASVLSDFPISREGAETQRARWEGGRLMLQRKSFAPLLAKIASGRLALVEPFLELMSLPLSYEVLVLGALALIPSPIPRAYGLAGLALVALQTILSAAIYGKPSDFKAFLEIPAYILWKLLKLPRIFRSSAEDAAWVRTKRD